VQSIAAAASVGELFRFQLKHPVDLARRRSAMLPIVNADVAAKKVSIYNQQVLAKHPLNGVRLNNTTGMKLMGGPITVFDAGSYAGDAQIDHLGDGDKRLLSYAIDLDVTVDPSVKSDSDLLGVKIVRGVLHVTRKYVYEQLYTISNQASAARTMVIEHPFHSGRELVEPKEPAEKTASMYRFDVPAQADKVTKFNVVEQQVSLQTIAILSTDVGSLVWYTKQGKISHAVREALGKAIEMRNELSTLERRLAERQKELAGIKDGQDRLRRNLATVGKDSELGRRYLNKLNDEETQIEKLEAEIDELRSTIEAKRKALDDYLNALNVE
jgi:hypothetical protein